ncbi:hypothetical protein DY000_02063855 [Brassica cretica]|uniref:Uncharacterized protein n=1 Tax=Brassica cretica TaxID=69181 RepID=A0ABQ7AZJ8_BRACR|nr:hypothetical protein DY000_02063855 [Brassica cretica]
MKVLGDKAEDSQTAGTKCEKREKTILEPSRMVNIETVNRSPTTTRSLGLTSSNQPSVLRSELDESTDGHEPVCSMWCSRPKPHLVSLQSIDGDVMASRKEDADTTALRWSQLRRRHSGENI